jgi:hypothetical protein
MKYLLPLLLVACGVNGNQRVTTEGETNHNITVDFAFIRTIYDICADIYEPDKKATAECAIDNLSILNINLSGELGLACPTGEIPPELVDFCSQIETGS